jgi:hypothetical protein
MPNIPGNIWTIILWVVLAILAVFLFREIVLPLISTIT